MQVRSLYGENSFWTYSYVNQVEKKDLELPSTPEEAEFHCGSDGVLQRWQWLDEKFIFPDQSCKNRHVLGRIYQANLWFRARTGSPWLTAGSYFARTEPRPPGTFLNTSRACFGPSRTKKSKNNKNPEKRIILYSLYIPYIGVGGMGAALFYIFPL